MIKQIILYTLISFACLTHTIAQEVVTGLQSNYSILSAKDYPGKLKGKAFNDTLELPLFDDFSQQSVFPDEQKWLDNFAFINNTYSDRQITIGVATMDAIDNYGRLYETASPSGFKADQLTSRPVNLDYPVTENIWLSFFYQPGGLGDPPEQQDSLTLQFLAPDENKWYSVWRASGNTDQIFKPVIIKVDEDRYLKKGFQFRFVNYASISSNLNDPSMIGNCDIWNIDYILLDKNRNAGDTIFADVAFRLPLRSILKSHESMPWKQFRQIYLQEMGSSIPIHYRNNDTITRNVTRNFEIWDMYKNTLSDYFSSGAANILPLSDVDYNANLIYTYNTDNNDSALFRIKCSLKTDEFDPKENDTLVYYQIFKNYFAFDDGTSEGGYGINGLGSRNAMVAYRFQSYMEDTLRAVQICFNDSYLDANKRTFDLMVWDDDNNVPGNNLYSLDEVTVEQGDEINGFYTYILPEGVMVNDVFYVGWRQLSETFLNAGFDVNTPNAGKQFYSLSGEWQPSQVQGSLMIRPVVGDRIKTTSINDIYYRDMSHVKIWPNPASDYINISYREMPLSGLSYIRVVDLAGRELINVPFSDRVDISSLREGMYFIITTSNGKPVGYNRLIKTK